MKSPADRESTWKVISERLLRTPPDSSLRLLVVAAHPDDEAIGASVLLAKFPFSCVAFLTDGAPRNSSFWTGGRYASRTDYAAKRRNEAVQALQFANVLEQRIFWLGGVDQEAAFEMQSLADKLANLLEQLRPDLLITHPYEGGHPDHDSAALISPLAVSQLSGSAPVTVEMTSYHAHEERCVTGKFLNYNPETELVFNLSEAEHSRKQNMFSAHASQRLLLGSFGTDRERFRQAPEYDFFAPPHVGELWYECLGWPITGKEWRQLAQTAISDKRGMGARQCA